MTAEDEYQTWLAEHPGAPEAIRARVRAHLGVEEPAPPVVETTGPTCSRCGSADVEQTEMGLLCHACGWVAR